MVTYQLDKDLDIEMAKAFLGHSRAGVDFGQGVWRHHPKLKQYTGDNHDEISQYVNQYYHSNSDMLTKIKEDFQDQWNMVEKDFIEAVIKIFKGFEFPDGDYIGYISVFNCNPRFLHNKTFQVYYKSDSNIRTTAHELMHFIFYEYTSQKLPKLVKDLNMNNGLWWDVAEIFNNVILSTNELKSILNITGDVPYPDHERYIEKATSLLQPRGEINTFVESLFELLKENNTEIR